MRLTVKPAGIRYQDAPHCVVCGTRRSLNGVVCVNLCHWMLEGWTAWDGARGLVKIMDHRATPLAALHEISFPKLVAIARSLGWSGNTASPSQPTFIGKAA